MSKMKSLFFLLIILPIITIAKAYYIANNGSDGNPGTIDKSWKTFGFAIPQLTPGDTLILKDGTYYETLDITVSGNSGNPIMIKAQNDGKVIIHGEGVRQTFICEGQHDLVIEGLVCKKSSKHVYKISNSSNLTLKRLSGSDAVNIDKNHHVFSIPYCAYMLVEDCIAYGTGRILYEYYGSHHGVFRRCWGRWKNNQYGSVRTCIAMYGSGDNIVENCVVTMEDSVTQRVEGIKVNRRDGNPYGSRNKIYGNVAYGLNYGNGDGFRTQGNEIMQDNEWLNNVSMNNTLGFVQRNDKSLNVRNCTAVGTDIAFKQDPYPNSSNPAYSCDYRVNANIRNCSFVTANTGIERDNGQIYLPNGCGGGPYYGQIDHDWNVLFDLGTLYSGTNPGANETSINPGYDGTKYGKGAYLMIPPPLRGIGENGADIGAEVLYRYVDGLLTSEPLWPWPMEDRIFAETGISVTWESNGGIWKTLDGVYGPRATTPIISPNGGTFPGPEAQFQVDISCATPDALIFYNTDGSTPTQLSSLYTSPFMLTITSTTTIKARAFKDGMSPSSIVSETYTVLPVQSLDGVTLLSYGGSAPEGAGLITAAVGGLYYTDRDYPLVSIPEDYDGGVLVQYANDDKTFTGDAFIVLALSEDKSVMVAYAHSATAIPQWLSDWESTGETVTGQQIEVEPYAFDVYVKRFSAGDTVVLGGNRQGGGDASTGYIVIVADTSGSTGISSSIGRGVPNNFGVFANVFTNKSEVTFVVSLDRPGDFTLQVYDISGCRVWNHYARDATTGFHRIIWDFQERNDVKIGNGLYFVVLRQKRRRAAGKVLIK